jgi:hypothetical protein
MAVLSILAAWVLLLWLVVALCQAARLGEAAGRKEEPARAVGEPAPVVASRAPSAPARREGYTGKPVVHAGGAAG